MVRVEERRNEGAKARGARRRGLAAVEMAIVAPLLFLLVIGIIDYGLIFLNAQRITQAARAGVRAAILPDATSATVDAAIDASLTASGINPAFAAVVLTPNDITAVVPGDPVKVQVTVLTDNLALIDTVIVPLPPQLVAVASMAKEGPS